METEATPVMILGTAEASAVVTDAGATYAPAEFTGTVQWVEITTPPADTSDRVKIHMDPEDALRVLLRSKKRDEQK